MITHFHHILNSLPNLAADVAIYFGDPCVSKILLGWMKNCSKIIHVAEHPKRYDPFHMITDRVICSPFAFINEILEFIPQKENSWLPYWRHLSHEVEKHLSIPTYSEPGLIQWLAQTPDSDSAYFFGNGMPIRDADMFFFPETLCGPIFGNRGLSGIDGNIATISGIAQNLPVTAVLGDQAVLHDLNSLALLKKTNYPVRLFIINNGGGGIFSLLPIQEKAEVLDRYFAAAHDKRFGDSARMFDLSYTLAKDASDFEKESDIIEILTSRTENASLHKKIDEEVKCAFSSMVS